MPWLAGRGNPAAEPVLSATQVYALESEHLQRLLSFLSERGDSTTPNSRICTASRVLQLTASALTSVGCRVDDAKPSMSRIPLSLSSSPPFIRLQIIGIAATRHTPVMSYGSTLRVGVLRCASEDLGSHSSLALGPCSSSVPSRVRAKPCRCGARVWVDVQVGSASDGGACWAALYHLL